MDLTFAELQARLLQHLQEIIRDRNPFLAMEGHFYVQQYIRQIWGALGTVESHEFKVRSLTHHNWILNVPGRQPQRAPILVGAHYDTVFDSPGADDNATGLAVLLELARHFSAHPAPHPLRFVAFDLEEYGLSGSRAYAESLKAQGQPLRLMLSLEMLGYCDPTPGAQSYPPTLRYFYPDTGDFIGMIGNWQTLLDLMRLQRQMKRAHTSCQWLPVIQQGQVVPDTRRSDHAPFWDVGYNAIMVTDTADLRNPHYHSHSDTLDTLDLDFLTRVCQGLMYGLNSL